MAKQFRTLREVLAEIEPEKAACYSSRSDKIAAGIIPLIETVGERVPAALAPPTVIAKPIPFGDPREYVPKPPNTKKYRLWKLAVSSGFIGKYDTTNMRMLENFLASHRMAEASAAAGNDFKEPDDDADIPLDDDAEISPSEPIIEEPLLPSCEEEEQADEIMAQDFLKLVRAKVANKQFYKLGAYLVKKKLMTRTKLTELTLRMNTA